MKDFRKGIIGIAIGFRFTICSKRINESDRNNRNCWDKVNNDLNILGNLRNGRNKRTLKVTNTDVEFLA